MKYKIIDSLGPFINPKNPPLNWSKIPFEEYEKNLDFSKVILRFETFISSIKKHGYNSISLDDLPHMVVLDGYSPSLKHKLKKFQDLYVTIIDIAKKHNVKVFINADIMYQTPGFSSKLFRLRKNVDLLKKSLDLLFSKYNVEGIITRIGECDGVDVKGMFPSKIEIDTPRKARKYIKECLPIFEKNNKKWIFRTWTIGGTKIGDLIWNKITFSKIFKDIQSDNLIISMKWGCRLF